MNGEPQTQDRKRGGGGKAILSELKIADFPETLDHIPWALDIWDRALMITEMTSLFFVDTV